MTPQRPLWIQRYGFLLLLLGVVALQWVSPHGDPRATIISLARPFLFQLYMFATAGFALWFGSGLVRAAKRRGFDRRVAYRSLLVTTAAASIATVLPALVIRQRRELVVLATAFMVPVLWSGGLTWWRLRHPRPAGERLTLLRRKNLGAGVIAFGVLVLALGHGRLPSVLLALVGLAMFMLGGYVMYLRDVLRYPERLPSFDGPPVFYLRSFACEDEPFVDLPWRPSGWHLASSGVPFDWYARESIGRRIGPLFAFGSPGDLVPQVGADRVYHGDQHWQAAFDEAVARSRAIVVVLAASEGLDWELARVRQLGAHAKLVLVNKPWPRHPHRVGLWVRYYRVLERLLAAPVREPPGAEHGPLETLDHMRRVGYVIDHSAAAPGAVVGFTRDARAVAVGENCYTPDEIATAIERALAKAPAPCEG